MEQTDHRRDVRAFLTRSAADTGWKIGTWIGLATGFAAGRSLRMMVLGSLVGMAIGWVVGKYQSRLL